MKKKKVILLIVTILVSLSCLFEFVYHTKVFGKYSEEKNYISFNLVNNAVELVECSEEIIICKAVKQTITTNRLKDDMPLTHYKVEVVSYLKGNGGKYKSVKILGGKRLDNTYVYYQGMPNLLIEGNYYLMFLNIKSNEKVITKDNVLNDKCQVISLDGYDGLKEINAQNEHIQYTISKYQNIIDKNVYGKDIIVGESYDTLKEKYDCYDNVFVGFISSRSFIINNQLQIDDRSYMNNSSGLNGVGSDAFTLSYLLNTDNVLKGNVSSNVIYQVGADVYQSNNGLEIIESGKYIIFANNEKNSNIESGAIPDDGLIITNSSQLVKFSEETIKELEMIMNK